MTTGGLASTLRSRFSWQTITGNTSILQEDGFRRLWIARLLSNTGVNAVLFTLLVLAVGEGGGSSIKSALFITAYLLPTALLATVSGVLVDRMPKNIVLMLVSVARLVFMLILLMSSAELWTIYIIALLMATTAQFSAPAEAAALPQVVRPDQFTVANSVNNLGGLLSQIIGFAVLPPLFLNLDFIGTRPLFFIAAGLFGGAAAFFFSIRSLSTSVVDIDSTIDALREMRKEFAQGWDTLKRDQWAYMSVIIFVLASTSTLVGVTLMPRFVEDALGIPVRNAIFVFLPAAIGILAGLRLVQWLEFRVPRGWLVAAGFALMQGSFICLALTKPFGQALETLNLLGFFDPGPFGDTTARIVVTIFFSTIAAFSFSIVGVASRSLVNARMPMEMQGRIFAAQHVLTNLASIPPILLAGLFAAAFGVEPVILIFVVLFAGVAGWSAAQAAARMPQDEDAEGT
ncbi:MAG: MFS transporter [Dehalococcoidia bacterium]